MGEPSQFDILCQRCIARRLQCLHGCVVHQRRVWIINGKVASQHQLRAGVIGALEHLAHFAIGFQDICDAL